MMTGSAVHGGCLTKSSDFDAALTACWGNAPCFADLFETGTQLAKARVPVVDYFVKTCRFCRELFEVNWLFYFSIVGTPK